MEVFESLPYDIQFKIFKIHYADARKKFYFNGIKYLIPLLGYKRLTETRRNVIEEHRQEIKELITHNLIEKILLVFPHEERFMILRNMEKGIFKYVKGYYSYFRLQHYRELVILGILLDKHTLKRVLDAETEEEKLKVVYRFIRFSKFYL